MRGDSAGGAACSQWLNNSSTNMTLKDSTEPASPVIIVAGFRINKSEFASGIIFIVMNTRHIWHRLSCSLQLQVSSDTIPWALKWQPK
jgi:hypothetical protein